MSKDKVESLAIEVIEQALLGQEIERNKVELKSKWYDLQDLNGVNEFLKDVTAIANTFGPEGFLIIGFDPKTKTFNEVKFADCGLKDPSDILGLFAKRLSNLIDLDIYTVKVKNHNLNVIHIPPCLEKPIVIKNYQKKDKKGNIKEEKHRIFVRKITGIWEANKDDLEIMYYDRKNIEPDYRLEVTGLSFKKISRSVGNFSIDVRLNIENLGRRSVSISNYWLKFYFGTEISDMIVIPASLVWRPQGDTHKSYKVGEFTEVLAPNSIRDIVLSFPPEYDGNQVDFILQQKEGISKFIEVETIGGKNFVNELKFRY